MNLNHGAPKKQQNRSLFSNLRHIHTPPCITLYITDTWKMDSYAYMIYVYALCQVTLRRYVNCVHTCLHTYTRTYIHILQYTCIHTSIYACIHPSMLTDVRDSLRNTHAALKRPCLWVSHSSILYPMVTTLTTQTIRLCNILWSPLPILAPSAYHTHNFAAPALRTFWASPLPKTSQKPGKRYLS